MEADFGLLESDDPGDGFEALRPLTLRPPSPRRAAQWWRELRNLPHVRARAAWLAAHALPPPDALRGAPHGPVPLRHARRWLRGVSHLLR